MKLSQYVKITNGLFYKRTKNGLVLTRKAHTKMTIKNNEIKKLASMLYVEYGYK